MVPNRPFTIIVANWSNVSITLLMNIVVAQCTALADTFWRQPFEGDRIEMIQLYNEAELKVQNLELHYAVALEQVS